MAAGWRFHTKLCKFESNASANNSTSGYCTDLRLGEVVYLLVFLDLFAAGRQISNGDESGFVLSVSVFRI